MGESSRFPTHYADDDYLDPICRGGKDGDLMSFFEDDVTCPHCLNLLGDGEVVVIHAQSR